MVRGLDVLALVVVRFLVPVARLRDGSVEMVATTRGFELPVVLRVEAISGLEVSFGSFLGRKGLEVDCYQSLGQRRICHAFVVIELEREEKSQQ